MKHERNLYKAQLFTAETALGKFSAAGTLCGLIDFVMPRRGTYTIDPDEVQAIIGMLQLARDDVLKNADPESDPRLYDVGARPV